MQPITDITAAVAVLNEHRFRDCDSWYVYEANGISMINGNGTFLSVGAEENAIAIANSLVLAERCAELETLLAECKGKPHSSKFNELSHKDQIEMLRAVIRVQPPSAAADCEPPHET